MAYKNIEDRKAASIRHYQANKKRYFERNKKYRKELSGYVNKIKEETPCADCLKNYPYYVMDFDHLEGSEKVGIVSYLCKTGRIGAMKKEILKCELVCANCHRERTHRRLQKNDPSYIVEDMLA
jgi:hypothetical protein